MRTMDIITKTTFTTADGTVPPGARLTLATEEAAQHIQRGLASRATDQDQRADVAKPTGKKLMADIVAAIQKLDPDEDFTKNGLPNVGAIEAILGYDISADERTTAFEQGKDGGLFDA